MTPGIPWRHEFGEPGSRFRINTPSLVLDLDALERNLAIMAQRLEVAGKDLRPHVKSHKCSKIARLQREHGAVGICCATLDEAETMALQNLPGILITSPVTTERKIERLIGLVSHAPDTMVVVDNPRNLLLIARAGRDAGCRVNVLVDVELGFGRTGVSTRDDAFCLARSASTIPGVRFAGIQAYGGHLQHIADAAERSVAVQRAGAYIQSIVDRLARNGMPPMVVSGGGTGTHAMDGEGSWFTEIQAGSYPLMDVDYGCVACEIDNPDWPFGTALYVQAAVVSANVRGTVTIDAGTKAIATNGPPPQVVTPGLTGAVYEFSGDEHGRLRLSPASSAPQVGDRVELVASHCDPTVALHDVYHCVRGDRLVDIWKIDARGRI